MDNPPDDGELLKRFAHAGDEAPFQELLRRHGQMVFQVCQRVLCNSADAEDAAQAVFLTLAQRARNYSLQQSASLGGWLHTLAWRIAKRLRASGGARKKHEREAAAMGQSGASGSETDELKWEKLRPVLDEALADLPEKYRLAIVLCDLEGRSQGEAAELMDTPKRTVSDHLARARELLRKRLEKRGVVLSVSLCASLLSIHANAGEAPAAFIASTAKAAVLALQGKLIAGTTVSGQTATLVHQAGKMLFWSTFKTTAITLILLSVLLGTALFGYWHFRNERKSYASLMPAAVVAETTPNAPVDLLKVIDPLRDTVAGNWTRKGDGIVSDVSRFARLQVPYEAPEEYDLTMVFMRASGTDEVAIVLKKDSGHQFRWVMGGWDNEIAGFDMINGKWPKENPSGKIIKSGVLKNYFEYTTLVQVRNDGIRAYLQGELISEYKTDYGDMRLWDWCTLPDSRTLGIISQNGALTVYTFTLTPVTGNGGLIKDARVQPKRIRPETF